ncbi:MAG: GNAT family N-acetyltransferase [Bacteroidota bacterium]
MEFDIVVASHQHSRFVPLLCQSYQESAKARGTGIALRKPEYLLKKIEQGMAVIALHQDQLAGFCYIESWSHESYVANSGLIVLEAYRKHGLAKAIKRHTFQLARNTFPKARVFGITTSLAVMKINSELGYRPVTFSELTQDESFWNGCQSCPNYEILQANQRKLCLCTGMLAPSKIEEEISKLKKNQTHV